MSTALKAMRAKMKAEKALYGPINRRGFFGKIDYWNKLIALPIEDPNIPEYLAGYDPTIISALKDIHTVVLLVYQLTMQLTSKLLKTEEKRIDRRCSCFRMMRRIGINKEQTLEQRKKGC